MKQLRVRNYILSFILVILISVPAMTEAQCPDAAFDPGCDPVTCTRADGSYCPIDSNLYLLLAAGVLYGLKKVRDQKKITPGRK
jgi:hypothetical protein